MHIQGGHFGPEKTRFWVPAFHRETMSTPAIASVRQPAGTKMHRGHWGRIRDEVHYEMSTDSHSWCAAAARSLYNVGFGRNLSSSGP